MVAALYTVATPGAAQEVKKGDTVTCAYAESSEAFLNPERGFSIW